MQTIQIDSGKKSRRFPTGNRPPRDPLPAGSQTVDYKPDDHINGRKFLTELIAFGWVPGDVIGRTLHLMHPAAQYREA